MNHLRWMGHVSTIMDIQRNLRHDTQNSDVTLISKEHSVQAHRFVLSACSDLLRSLLADVPLGQEATLIIPDIKGPLLDSVIAFIYVGETSLSSTNLSEFLEAINILGIKSAISFECNPAALSSPADSANATAETLKALTEIQMGGQVELMEQDAENSQKIDNTNLIPEQPPTRELFFDVYGEPPAKISYAIEHLPGASTASEFILTENSGTFTLTPNTKLENPNNNDANTIEEIEDEDVDSQIIEEEYTSVSDPIIEVGETIENTSNETSNSIPIIYTKPKIKSTFKIKTPLETQQQQPQHHQESQQEDVEHATDDSNNTNEVKSADITMSTLSTTTDSFTTMNETQLLQTDDSLELAVQAVLSEGYSLAKAAVKYDVSKTVLWRRVRKYPNYMKSTRENPVFTEAYDRLRNGDSLKKISKELDIPMSTLHRHKVRLSQQGRLPAYMSVRKRESLSKEELKERLAKAVHACVHDGMSQNHAANLYEIPKSTLWRHLQRRVAEAELEIGDIKEEVILP